MPSFLESPRFPEIVSAWALGGPEFKTLIAANGAGVESRNIVWQYPLSSWEIGAGLREVKDAQATIAFHRKVYGRALGFRFKDPFDNTADDTSGAVGPAAIGSGLPAYQLYKNYPVDITQYANRQILKPVIGSLSIKRAGVLQTQGVAAGNYAVDYTTGIVTFVADATSAITGVTVGASTVVQLAGALAGLGVGDKLYVSGLGGADAALLNGLAHTISAIAGGNYTVSTNTAGKTITASGTGAKYPQPSQTLTWAGEFDVPVRFDNDKLDLQLDEGGLLQYNNITVRELRE
jgi:uncharacterized protein (TIGR02217 family)